MNKKQLSKRIWEELQWHSHFDLQEMLHDTIMRNPKEIKAWKTDYAEQDEEDRMEEIIGLEYDIQDLTNQAKELSEKGKKSEADKIYRAIKKLRANLKKLQTGSK
jgi:hypothetical protein